VPGASGIPAPKMQTSADSSQPEETNLESCCSAPSAHGTARTEAQRLGLLACLATSIFKRRFGFRGGCLRQQCSKKQTSADSSQPERASLESCCSASSVHGTSRTEAQRLGLLTSLATSNFRRSFRGPFRASPAALLPKCERLQIARTQKGLAWKAAAQPHLPMALLVQMHRDWAAFLSCHLKLQNVVLGVHACHLRQSCSQKCKRLQIARRQKGLAWKAVAQHHLPMALLAQRHIDWGCLLVLQPPTSNVDLGSVPGSSGSQAQKSKLLQIARRQKELAWKAVTQPHLPMALLAQGHRDWGCLLVLPPQTSNVSLGVCGGSLLQPCSKNANVCR